MAKSPKILFVTTTFHLSAQTGCTIRTMNIAGQLQSCGEVTMLSVSPYFNEDTVETAKKLFGQVHLVRIDNNPKYGKRLDNIIKKYHMHCPWNTGRKADAEGQKLFKELVAKHDIVWFHTLGAANAFYLRNIPNSVMDLDDLNHCKFELRSKNDKTLRLRMSARLQSIRWKKQEVGALKLYDRTIVCSKTDKDLLGGGDNIYVVPNGFTMPENTPKWQKPDQLRLGFIGTLAYGPNRDGLIWFRDKVWPIIKKHKPGMTLRIAGSQPPQQQRVIADGFESLGFIEDTTEEFSSWLAMVVPILYGGGTRIKILEAFSKLCPVISTSAGAHGIDATHEKDIFLADDPEEFAKYCLELSDSPEKGKIIAQAGWELFQSKYDWDVIGESVRSIVRSLQ